MMLCWHQPGRMSLSGKLVTCRHCGVAIEYCPCVGPTFRSLNHDCTLCLGSMWVAVVRGWRLQFRAYLEDRI